LGKRPRPTYLCSDCGEAFSVWSGRCSSCGSWNTLEVQSTSQVKNLERKSKNIKGAQLHQLGSLPEINRVSTGLEIFDDLLGGGLVPGSTILLGGEPGIGKSTLLLELGRKGLPTLYVSGEESLGQIARRAQRLKIDSKSFQITTENEIDAVLQTAEKTKNLKLLCIDSIQTAYCLDSNGVQGSISQIREVIQRLSDFAKSNSIAVILTAHVTKEGSIAGPKQLEHAVDTVLYFESQSSGEFRFIRATKNRFASTGSLAVFEMKPDQLKPVDKNKQLLDTADIGGPGSVIFPQKEGQRFLALEVQALVTPTGYTNGRRICAGLDQNRLYIAIALLEKYGAYRLGNCDVFVRVLGGVPLKETAGDLPLLLALMGSYWGKSPFLKSAAAGEVSFTGKIRPATNIEERMDISSSLELAAFVGGQYKSGPTAALYQGFDSLADLINVTGREQDK
jgi:DNA repair protein RadA/Sms